MKNDKIVIINGQQYDSTTGLPLVKPDPNATETKNKINDIQSLTHESNKIRPNNTQKTVNDVRSSSKTSYRKMDISRSKNISHFADKTIIGPKKASMSKKRLNLEPIKRDSATISEKTHSKLKNISTKSNKSIKQEVAITTQTEPIKKNNQKKFTRLNTKFINIFSIGLILLMLLGYLVYINLPIISVHIASAQAGIKATYPEYSPNGYNIKGPVSYSNGEVTINFHAETGDNRFVIKQSKSSWDSSAVKLQADKESNNETSESKEGGLTIYTYDNNRKAIWVNGGILYTISGNAELSGEQIRHIATSL